MTSNKGFIMEKVKKEYLSPKELQLEYGLKISTTAKWRMKKKNIPFSKIGKAIKYKRLDVENFLDSVSVVAEVS